MSARHPSSVPPECADCLSATGGVCRAHAQPECTCLELLGSFGGHQPGCAFYVPLNAAGRPPTSACHCTTWPCSCACHQPPRPRLTLLDVLEGVAYRVWRAVKAIERRVRG